jgi:hypothetical protein
MVSAPSSKLKTLKLPSNFRSPSGLSSFRIEALSRWLGLISLPLCPARFPFAPRKRQLVLLTNLSRIIVPGSLPPDLAAKPTGAPSHSRQADYDSGRSTVSI